MNKTPRQRLQFMLAKKKRWLKRGLISTLGIKKPFTMWKKIKRDKLRLKRNQKQIVAIDKSIQSKENEMAKHLKDLKDNFGPELKGVNLDKMLTGDEGEKLKFIKNLRKTGKM